jgi:hypothetical protein
LPNLQTLLQSAEDLRVDAVAQRPFCAEPKRLSPRQTYDDATKLGFDWLPVRDSDNQIRRIVSTSSLRDAASWDVVVRDAVLLDADALVARDAPVFSLLDRFVERDVLFSLGRHGVDGVVTIFDLNQPAAHLLGFGLILITESEIARVLREHLGEDAVVAKARVVEVLGKRRMGVRRWEQAREQDKDLHLASCLTLGEKLELLPRYGLDDLASRSGLSHQALLDDLRELKSLRDALAHYDDADRLADPRWVHDRMRRAHAQPAAWLNP